MNEFKTLINNNPTHTEEMMYIKLGLYLYSKTDDIYEYVLINYQNYSKFPKKLRVNTKDIDISSKVIFNRKECTVSIINLRFDKMDINILDRRLQELKSQC